MVAWESWPWLLATRSFLSSPLVKGYANMCERFSPYIQTAVPSCASECAHWWCGLPLREWGQETGLKALKTVVWPFGAGYPGSESLICKEMHRLQARLLYQSCGLCLTEGATSRGSQSWALQSPKLKAGILLSGPKGATVDFRYSGS